MLLIIPRREFVPEIEQLIGLQISTCDLVQVDLVGFIVQAIVIELLGQANPSGDILWILFCNLSKNIQAFGVVFV